VPLVPIMFLLHLLVHHVISLVLTVMVLILLIVRIAHLVLLSLEVFVPLLVPPHSIMMFHPILANLVTLIVLIVLEVLQPLVPLVKAVFLSLELAVPQSVAPQDNMLMLELALVEIVMSLAQPVRDLLSAIVRPVI
jgi:hypothetical protein